MKLSKAHHLQLTISIDWFDFAREEEKNRNKIIITSGKLNYWGKVERANVGKDKFNLNVNSISVMMNTNDNSDNKKGLKGKLL